MRPLIRLYFRCLLIVLLSSSHSFAQNLPPFIGNEIKNPGIKVPNPMEQSGSQRQDTGGQPSPTKAQEAEIRQFLEGLTSAYGSRNKERVVSVYVQDPGLIISWNGKLLTGASEFNQAMDGWLKQFDTLSVEFQQPNIHVLGRFAWITSQCRVRTYRGGVESLFEGTITWVLERKRSAWVILHEHRTLLSATAKSG